MRIPENCIQGSQPVINNLLLVQKSSVETIKSVYTWLADENVKEWHLLCLGVVLWLEAERVFESVAFCSPGPVHRSMLSFDHCR